MSREYSGTTSNVNEHIPLDAKYALDNEPVSAPGKKKLREGIKEICYEYCSNTSLHGVQYLGQKRPWVEILLWLCIFVISIFFCTQTIVQIYDKWNDTPVIVSFSERSTPISEIPFPALTICSETRRVKRKNDFNYGLLLVNTFFRDNPLPSNFTEGDREKFLTLLQTCNTDDFNQKSMPRLWNETLDYIRIIEEMSIPLHKQIEQCKWLGFQTDSCEDLLTPTYTEDGLCFTFNGFNGTDLYRENTIQYQHSLQNSVNISSTGRINRTLTWSLEGGYPKNEPLRTYPARVVGASTRASFVADLLTVAKYADAVCSGATQGFKIIIHTPDDVPTLSKGFVRISPKQDMSIVVKPIMVTTSAGIAKYPHKKRKCFMNNERYLKFFKVYSEKNCEMECLTNYTLRECECVKFSMPRTADMPVCTEDKIKCYIEAEEKMLLENFNSGDDSEGCCNCMPSCTSLEFDVEVSQGDYDIKNLYADLMQNDDNNAITSDIDFNLDDVDNVINSHINVHFKDSEFITSKRSELYGFSEFLANCGGVLGLFMGFSILSLVEILYHATLRLWSNMRRKENLD